jgi:hypothetical protein
MNLHIIIRKSAELNSPHYAGVAKTLMAYALMNMTDVWNDIPYSEAFMGQDNLKPKFDTQEEIYTSINTLLTEAITDLASTTNDIPLDGDMIYDGDLDMWTQAAYSLMARAALHLEQKVGYAAILPTVTSALANGFQSNADDLEFTFGTSALGSNPYYQFIEQRDDHAVSTTTIAALNANSDPRLPMFVEKDGNGNYTGCTPGLPESAASRVGPYFASRTSPVAFMSYVELKFIEAEVLHETGDKPGAAAAYNAAVIASLAKYGVSDAAWEATNANEDNTTITLNKILAAKSIALFLQFENYNDFRRHDNPLGLAPASNNTTNGVFPQRYPYATSEKIYNGDNVPSVAFSDHVWWDN